ncbi:MAG TPA: hemerythrin domain-containing protein [Thermoplasmata archaeon]|nr:hemerythrin domain-containing protein [Thermoplasmata archaeon]
MDPLLSFHRDHEAIRPRLRTFEAALDAAQNRAHADEAERRLFLETVAFLQSAALDHFRREEVALLPLLEAKVGRYGSLVNVIAYDHDEVRRELGKLGDAVKALEASGGGPPALYEVNRHGIFLIQYLSLHMAKEDAYFSETAREVLGPAGLADVSRLLEGLP